MGPVNKLPFKRSTFNPVGITLCKVPVSLLFPRISDVKPAGKLAGKVPVIVFVAHDMKVSPAGKAGKAPVKELVPQVREVKVDGNVGMLPLRRFAPKSAVTTPVCSNGNDPVIDIALSWIDVTVLGIAVAFMVPVKPLFANAMAVTLWFTHVIPVTVQQSVSNVAYNPG
eukprot:NODE_920_length_3091_cov_0.248997.p2 type:complete len:169 gc:universal NODE_920_length_3091_cov_0.248997:1032-526(-)